METSLWIRLLYFASLGIKSKVNQHIQILNPKPWGPEPDRHPNLGQLVVEKVVKSYLNSNVIGFKLSTVLDVRTAGRQMEY